MHSVALKARYVLPVDRPPIADGVVQMAGTKIVAVGRTPRSATLQDLGNVALLPGLVNAHTHLEFSHLERPLGRPGISLSDWIRQVIAWRSARADDPATAVAAGLRQSAMCGTTALGDISTSRPAAGSWGKARGDMTCFFEVMARPESPRAELFADLCEKVTCHAAADRWQGGVSPHSPYTVPPELLAQLTRFAAEERLPLAMHLAESRAELQLLRSGDGPLRDLLVERDLWDHLALPRGLRPLDYLRQIARTKRSLVIHGNYLDDDELAFLAAHGDQMTLVFCPRTHAFFRHVTYPLAKALALGVHVALGTDSRASNPDLSLLDEMRFVAQHYPDVSPANVVRLATFAGARALGRDHNTGTITAGKLANLTAIALPDRAANDPYEALLAGNGSVVETWYQGRPLGASGAHD